MIPSILNPIHKRDILSLRDSLLKQKGLSSVDIERVLTEIDGLLLTSAAGQKQILAFQKQLILSYQLVTSIYETEKNRELLLILESLDYKRYKESYKKSLQESNEIVEEILKCLDGDKNISYSNGLEAMPFFIALANKNIPKHVIVDLFSQFSSKLQDDKWNNLRGKAIEKLHQELKRLGRPDLNDYFYQHKQLRYRLLRFSKKVAKKIQQFFCRCRDFWIQGASSLYAHTDNVRRRPFLSQGIIIATVAITSAVLLRFSLRLSGDPQRSFAPRP